MKATMQQQSTHNLVSTLPLTPQRVTQKANLSYKNRFPYISIIDEASDFKFGMQLRFAKARHEIPLAEKLGVALGKGSSPKFGASPLIFLQRLKLATLNLVCS